MSNTTRYPQCHMRTVLGNCDPIGGFCTSVNESICEALHKVSRPQGEWIPCSERLPEEDGYYLITLDFEWGREIEIGLWADGEWLNDNRHVNIAWMPMIKPWKGADDDNGSID